MVINCQVEKGLPVHFILWLCCSLYSRAYVGSEPYVATIDQSDIRGLDTARPVFIAELPLSKAGSSVKPYPTGYTRILLTRF